MRYAVNIPLRTPNGAITKAMIRDNFRCVISGSIEYYAAFKVPELEEAALALKCLTPVAPTVCTHIIPTTINTHTATVSDKVNPILQRSFLAKYSAVERMAYLETIWVHDSFKGVKQLQNTPSRKCYDSDSQSRSQLYLLVSLVSANGKFLLDLFFYL